GRITRSFTPTNPPCFGVATVDGLIYAGHGQDNLVDVFSRDGTLVGQRTLPYSVGGLGGDSLGGGIRTQRVNVASGEVVEGIDFGNQSSLSEIRGIKWNDLDGDGVRDAEEPALAGWQIYVDLNANGKYDHGEPTATTAADGSYAISGLPGGAYVVAEVPQVNWQPTYPGSVGQATLFGIQPNTNTLVQLDPVTGAVVRSFPLPVAANSQCAGLSGADDGQSLIFQTGNSDQLFRIDPNTGRVLSAETMPASQNYRGGLSFESGTTSSIFANNGSTGVQRQDGYGGSVSSFIEAVHPWGPGAMGGDDYGRHFVFADGQILEFDPQTPNTILKRLPSPATNLAGLAFDGFRLYASTTDGYLFTLDPNTGAILNRTFAQSGYLAGLGVANLATRQRFFAISTSGGGIAEIDPTSGQALRGIRAPESWGTGLAFDGRHLFFIKGDGLDTLWELDPQTGVVLDSDPITVGSGNYDGLAALNGKIYILDYGADDLLEFDPLTDTITRVLDINGINPGANLVGGLAGIRSPDALLATVGANTLVEIDPASGRITRSFPATTQQPIYRGVAVIDGLIYVGSGLGNQTDVFSRDGTLVDQRMSPYAISSLGGDSVGVGSLRTHPVYLGPGEVLEGIDFGSQSSLSEIRGVKWNDLDSDGVRDAEEPALAGWQIYIDRNTNGKYDAGEPTATTAADGSYVITGLPSGAYVVAEVPQPGWQPTYPGSPGQVALFGIQPNTNKLVQLDPATGAVVRSFSLPVATDSQYAGLSGADDGQSLIFQTGDSGPLYRIDPNTGRVLSVETRAESGYGPTGLSFETGATASIFAFNGASAVQRQDGYGGSLADFVANVFPGSPGAMGGDDYGRHFVFAQDAILEFDPQTPNTILRRLPAPATNVAGLAFDGFRLYASTLAGDLFTLDPNTGAILNQTFAQGGYLIGLGVANLVTSQRLFAIPTDEYGTIVELDWISLSESGSFVA
ncbi:MAG: SdrD B-like domain-containing protein, partial [Thermoguttaceae bacterium]